MRSLRTIVVLHLWGGARLPFVFDIRHRTQSTVQFGLRIDPKHMLVEAMRPCGAISVRRGVRTQG